MSFLNFLMRIPALFANFMQRLFMPLTQAESFRRAITMPFRILGRFFSGIWGFISQFLTSLGVLKPTSKKASTGDTQGVRAWLSSWRAPARLKRRQLAPQRAQFSQIHIVPAQGERSIAHIGTIIGRSESEILLKSSEHSPVRLSFQQVDPRQVGAPVVMSYSGGTAKLSLGGQAVPLLKPFPIKHETTLMVDGVTYTLELYAWHKSPIVSRVEAGWATSTGPVRTRNEDAIGIYQHPNAYLFAVADGVGGGEDGDRISEFAICYLLAAFHRNVNLPLKWSDILATAYQYINAEVRHYGTRSPSPVGTTLTSLVIQDWEAQVAHVGDSRLYHYQKGALRLLTTDHVRKIANIESTRHAVESNEEAQLRDVLIKAIGKADGIQPDLLSFRLQPNDKILLCSDGLIKYLSQSELVRLTETIPAKYRAQELLNIAIQRGANDNVSVVTLDVMERPYTEDLWDASPSERVYVNYSPRWQLRLTRSTRYDTQFGTLDAIPSTGRGVWVVLAILALLAGLVWANTRPQPNEAILSTVPAPAPITATPTLSNNEALNLTATAFSLTEVASPTPIPPTSTPPAPPTNSATPRPSVTPSPTLIPPTSTLRPALGGG